MQLLAGDVFTDWPGRIVREDRGGPFAGDLRAAGVAELHLCVLFDGARGLAHSALVNIEDAAVSAHQSGIRDAFVRADCDVVGAAVRNPFPYLDPLFSAVRILPFHEPVVLLPVNGSGQSQILGELAVPLAPQFAALRVIGTVLAVRILLFVVLGDRLFMQRARHLDHGFKEPRCRLRSPPVSPSSASLPPRAGFFPWPRPCAFAREWCSPAERWPAWDRSQRDAACNPRIRAAPAPGSTEP